MTDLRILGAGSPFGRVCQPEDIAKAVIFPCSEEAAYITNQRITVHSRGF